MKTVIKNLVLAMSLVFGLTLSTSQARATMMPPGIATFKAILKSGALLSLLDNGLYRLLAMESYNHGTNIKNYLSILYYGADPTLGGKADGSTNNVVPEFVKNCKNYFYMFKDSELEEWHFYYTDLKPLEHSLYSTRNWLGDTTPGFAFFIAFLTPTVKFRFDPMEIENEGIVLENDPDYVSSRSRTGLGPAYRTHSPISPTHLGIFGTLYHGLNKNIFERISNNPERSLSGLALLTLLAAYGSGILPGGLLFLTSSTLIVYSNY